MNSTSGPERELPDDEDLRAIYGDALDRTASPESLTTEKRKAFLPWHHPVKQVVRDRQWADLTFRLVDERTSPSSVLRYFTLPGADLLDVRVLAEGCGARGVKIEYFGFNTGYIAQGDAGAEAADTGGGWITAESALRQAERITDGALILPDRLEDIAIEKSQAAAQLRLREPFDVINIDACDHLAYRPAGRDVCTFDALHAILKHQMIARRPWLLFVTTRVEPGLLGTPGLAFQRAIDENLRISEADFGAALAAAIGANASLLQTDLARTWTAEGQNFLKLYTVGLGKFLLQFFHSQPNLPAEVELASAYAYRVSSDQPDMLALAFRIKPEGQRALPPHAGGATAIPLLEPQRAIRLANRACRLQDLDNAMEQEADLRETAIRNTETLLKSAHYDEAAWRAWLEAHPRRPMTIGVAAAATS